MSIFMHVYMSVSTSRLPEKICRSRCGRLKHAGALISEHTGTHTRQVILTKQLVRTWTLQHSQGARRQQMHTYTQTSASEHWSRSKRCMWSFHTDPAFSHLPDNAHILGPTHQTARHKSMKLPFTIMWNKELSKRQKKKRETRAQASYRASKKLLTIYSIAIWKINNFVWRKESFILVGMVNIQLMETTLS